MASFLPIPSIREFWNAKGGGLFFIKWMVFNGAHMVGTFLFSVPFTMTNSGIHVSHSGFLWFLPPFLPPLALFGFHWRTLAWGGVTIGVVFLTALLWPHVSGLPPDIIEQLLRLSLLFASLAILPHALLLVNVRRRPFLWMLAYPFAILLSHHLDGVAMASPIWKLLKGVPVPWLFAQTVTNCLPGLAGAALVGILLIWLMPPVTKPEAPEASTCLS